MSIRIIKRGIADTFQDEGRFGYQYLGINPNGAMDKAAMQVANALTGNPLNEAVLEMHFPAAEICFEADALIALAGANFKAVVNNVSLPINQPILLKKNSVLRCTQPANGARLYCSIRGGFNLSPWLNSNSTNRVCSMGGFNGRALDNDDVIAFRRYYDYPIVSAEKPVKVLPYRANITECQPGGQIEILPGEHLELLTAEGRSHFETVTFTVGPQSNRMGYRLQSQPLLMRQNIQLVSSAVTMGTIQLLPSGQLIILMADHQTTGGYPVVGHVITAQLSKLAQCRPGDTIQFTFCTQEQAAMELLRQHNHLLQLQNACTFRLTQFV